MALITGTPEGNLIATHTSISHRRFIFRKTKTAPGMPLDS
jgi:hypothetical protein